MLNKVPVFHFQTTIDLIDHDLLLDFKRFCKSTSFENLNFEDKWDVDGVGRFRSCA